LFLCKVSHIGIKIRLRIQVIAVFDIYLDHLSTHEFLRHPICTSKLEILAWVVEFTLNSLVNAEVAQSFWADLDNFWEHIPEKSLRIWWRCQRASVDKSAVHIQEFEEFFIDIHKF